MFLLAVTTFSPAAQMLVDAYEGDNMSAGLDGADPGGLAAVLRSAADSAPAPSQHEEDAFHAGFWAAIEYVRSLAVELDATYPKF